MGHNIFFILTFYFCMYKNDLEYFFVLYINDIDRYKTIELYKFDMIWDKKKTFLYIHSNSTNVHVENDT